MNTRSAKATAAANDKVMLSTSLFNEIQRRYREVWHRDWPHDNAAMAELWFEAKTELGIPRQSKQGGEQVKKLTVEKMRFDHDFGS